MRNFLIGCTALAFANLSSLYAEFNQPMFNAELTAGYRRDNFSFSIKDFADFSDASWTMYWKGLEIAETTFQIGYVSCNNYAIKANGGWGSIRNGDFTARGRTKSPCSTSSSNSSSECGDPNVFSRIKGDANKGNVWDLQAAIGYQLTSNGRRVVITPWFGWAAHALNLRMDDAKQVVNRVDVPPILGKIPGLKASYEPRIRGPFVGLDFLAIVECPCVLLFGSLEFQWSQFYATGKWNFNDRFVQRFKDRTHGKGMIAYLGFDYRISCNWSVGVVGYYRNWHGREGKHRTKSLRNILPNGDQVFGTMPSIPVRDCAHLGRVCWDSWSVALAFDYRVWDGSARH